MAKNLKRSRSSESEYLGLKSAKYNKSRIVDRTLLTRKQHDELLAIPRPMFGPAPPPSRGKKLQCKIPKICPPRVDQLSVPKVKQMEGVLKDFNATLEPVRIVRLVKLIHAKETERPLFSPRKGKHKKKKKKKSKKEKCLKVWLKKRSKASAKLVMNALRERKEVTPNYRQLLVALGLMKAMRIKKKKHLPRYTKQYLMNICEQIAILCDTEWAPYKKLPVTPEAVPLEPAESEISRKHIFWKMREPVEEEEEEEEEVEEGEEEEEEEEPELIEEEPEVIVIKDEVEEEDIKPKEEPTEEKPIKEEMPSIAEVESAEESIYDEYYEDQELSELEAVETGDEAEEYETSEGSSFVYVLAPDEEEGEAPGEDEGEAPAETGEEPAEESEEPVEESEDVGDVPEGGDLPEEAGGDLPEEVGGEEQAEEGDDIPAEEEGEAPKPEEPAVDEIGGEIEGGVELEGGISQETDQDTVEPEDTDFEPVTDLPEEEGEIEEGGTAEEPFVGEEGEMPKDIEAIEAEIQKEETASAKGEAKPIEKPKPEKKPEPEKKPKPDEKAKEPAKKPEEIADVHPPGTVSYLSWKIYSSWLEELGNNIQMYGTCLHKFRNVLEADTNLPVDKIHTILANWSTYLTESLQFEMDMSNYFKGKQVTKCSKCGEFTLYNIPKDHELPDELKQATLATSRWKRLLVEAEELCKSFSATDTAQDTVSLRSHDTIDMVEGSFDTSDTSMYLFEDYFPDRR